MSENESKFGIKVFITSYICTLLVFQNLWSSLEDW